MKPFSFIPLFVTMTFVLTGCYYDVEEELYPDSVNCDLTNVTFSGTIEPLIVAKCQSCHNDGNMNGNISLEGHQKIVEQVNNGNLMGAIRHEPGYAAMPQGEPQLPTCQIEEIQKWIDNGAPND